MEINKKLFDEKLKIFRQFQLDAFNSSKTSNIGQIFLPTGTGKTLIQLAIHVDDMINKPSGEYGVYVIAAHRLVLCNQLFDEFKDFVSKLNIPASYIYVGSEQSGESFEVTRIPQRIKEIVNQNKHSSHTIIVSTYNSFHQLSDLDQIDVCTYDEVHRSVRNDFQENIAKVKHKITKNYFFTATKKEMDDGTGQNDEIFYGRVLYDLMPPAKAIEEIEIVTPKIHQIKVADSTEGTTIENNISMFSKVIISSFIEHKKIIDETSHKRIGAKILINTQGLHQVDPFKRYEPFKHWCMANKINFFSFSSNQGENVNFNGATRQTALEKLQSLKDEEDAIIFHYNILSEGIDLPNLTGVIILRNVDLLTFTQMVGRSCRLLKSDRIRLYTNKIQKVEELVKPECWVIIPEYEGVDPNILISLTKYLRTVYQVPTKMYHVNKLPPNHSDIEREWGKRKFELGMDNQELEHIVEKYTETIEYELDKMFEKAIDKRKFLMDLLDEVYDIIDLTDIVLPKEDIPSEELKEGTEKEVSSIIYERHPKAREACLKAYGNKSICQICGKEVKYVNGESAIDVIEVHHITPISEIKETYIINPLRDLIPICPTCHTLIHKRNPCYTPEEAREILRNQEEEREEQT